MKYELIFSTKKWCLSAKESGIEKLSIVCAKVRASCLEYLGYITLKQGSMT
jgi:hypothetical protein